MENHNISNSPTEEVLKDIEKTSDDGSTDSSSWNTTQEELLKAISERSNCMRWLHTQCNIYFENINFYLTIPNVVISTINGGFTMSLPSLLPDGATGKVATTIIGLISLLSAMLITMNQYIKSQQMMEAHRAAALAYSKLHRMVSNELSLRRDQRINALDFLKHIRTEQDRLESISPLIVPHVIKMFNVQFRERDIEKPEITGDLDPVEVNIKNRYGKNYNIHDNKASNRPESVIRIISGITSVVKNKIFGKSQKNISSSTRDYNPPIDFPSRRDIYLRNDNISSRNFGKNVIVPISDKENISVVTHE